MKVAVILSGCGYLDGAEIRESVLSLLFLDEAGAEVSIFAPDEEQYHVVDHRNGTQTTEKRNILQETARIARGDATPLADLHPAEFDALVIPGGFGVAKNLSDLAFKGKDMQPHEEFARVVREFYETQKPIGAICIAPAVIAGILRDTDITLTIGDDTDTAQLIRNFGNEHRDAATDKVVVDSRHRIASCSAYMRSDARISDVAKGISGVVDAVVKMIKQAKQQAA